jgi:hypothetical protein
MKNTSGDATPFSKGFLMPALTAFALVTACGLFQPASIAPQVSSVEVVQPTARVQAGNPGVTPATSSVKVQFNVPMNQPSVTRSINIYKGSYDATAPLPANFQKLQLTSMCDGRWRVRNANTQPVSFQWDVYNTTQKGIGVAAGAGDTLFQSTTGSNTLRVFVNGALQNTKATNPAACADSLYSFAWSDSRTVQVTPNVALEAGKAYTLAVSTAAKNEAGTQELVVPFSSGFTPQIGAFQRFEGVLNPSSSLNFGNGVTISAPDGTLLSAETMYSQQVTASDLPAPVPDDYEIIGGFYRVGIVGNDISTANRNVFNTTLPIPPGIDPRSVGVIFVTPKDTDLGEVPAEWSNWVGEYDASTNRPLIGHADLYRAGTIFVLYKLPFITTSNNLVKPLAEPDSFTAVCIDLPCSPETKNQYATLAQDSYALWTSVMTLLATEAPLLKTKVVNLRTRNCKFPLWYDSDAFLISVCIDANGKVISPLTRLPLNDAFKLEGMKHEMFHATQWGIANAAKISPKDKIPFKNVNTQQWIIEGTAAAAGVSGTTVAVSPSWDQLPINHIFYPVPSGPLDDATMTESSRDQYRVQDFWAFVARRLGSRSMNLFKNLFRVNTANNNTYTILGSSANALIVSRVLHGEGYMANGSTVETALKQAFWDYSKNQSMELRENLRAETDACDVNRTFNKKEYDSNSQELNYVNLATQKYSFPSLNSRQLTTRLWNITFNNIQGTSGDVQITLKGKNNNTRFIVYKVTKINPINCQSTLDILSDSTVIRGISNDDRLVVLAANTAYADVANFQLDVERISPDIDDGTLDGNQLAIIGNSSATDANNDGVADSTLPTDALRLLSAAFTGEDADANGRIGNGRVNMADFRRMRDWLLRSEGFGTFVGSAGNPKLGVVAGSSALKYGDFNNSGSLNFNGRKAVPGLEGNGFTVSGFNIIPNAGGISAQSVPVTRDAQGVPLLSDFEVFYNTIAKTPGTWVDTDYTLPQITQLLGSGDLEVWARDLFDYPSVVKVVSEIENASFGAGYIHTRGDQRHVYSAPAGTYFVRLAALDVNNDVIVGLKKTVTLAAGQDVLFAPATALTAVVKTTYNSAQDDCARLQGVYSFNAPGLFDTPAPDLPTGDAFMALGQNLFPIIEKRKLSNWPLQLESGTYRHCNFPGGQARLTWNFNYDFFGSTTSTGFIVQTFNIVTIQDNRWPGLVWNSTDFNDPQTTGASVPLKITATSSFPGEPQQIIRSLQPGTSAALLLRPALEAQYQIEGVDDDTNPNTAFGPLIANVNIPYITDAKLTYRGSSAWHHQIFCDISAACASGGAGIQSQRSSGPSTSSLTAPALPVPVIAPRPNF